MGHTNHRDFGNPPVRLYRLLDLASANTMSSDIDDIIGSTQKKVVSLFIAHRQIKSRISLAGCKCRKIRFDESGVIIPKGGKASGRRRYHPQVREPVISRLRI